MDKSGCGNRMRLAVLTFSAVASLQAQNAKFDAATVRPNRSGAPQMSIDQQPGGRFVMTNGNAQTLLLLAFLPRSGVVTGATDWIVSERYDVIATANAAVSPDQMREMLRSMLNERFNLSAHLEPRDQAVYYLRVARIGGLGPRIERTPRDCDAVEAAVRAGQPAPTLAAPSNGAPPCGIRMSGPDGLVAGGITMDVLARNLGPRAGRVVLDRTGLSGRYDLTLRFSLDQGQPNSDVPSIFTALQEQLGLKLEPGRAALDTLVVDRIERPREN